MKRRVYVALLRLHPRPFRDRFGADMLWIFDQTDDSWAMLGDAAVSLFRQRLFRREVEEADPPAVSTELSFYSCDISGPSRTAVAHGGWVSLLLFGSVAMALGIGGDRKPMLIGSHHPSRSNLLGVAAGAAPQALSTEVKVAPYPWENPIPEYFKLIPILAALDADQDGVISSVEIADAPEVLRKFDSNRDGRLSAEECGGRFSGNADWIAHARRMFMRVHPALAALDHDGDGEISAKEIAGSAAALRSLDENGVGSLTEEELMPPPVDLAVGLVLAFDLDGDGEISRDERKPMVQALKDLLERADQNGNGRVTKGELRIVLGAK